SRAQAVAFLDASAGKLKERLAPSVYGEDDADLAAVVLDMCRPRKVTIAVAESCTGGMLGQRLSAIPGASEACIGGIIAYERGGGRRDEGWAAGAHVAGGARGGGAAADAGDGRRYRGSGAAMSAQGADAVVRRDLRHLRGDPRALAMVRAVRPLLLGLRGRIV